MTQCYRWLVGPVVADMEGALTPKRSRPHGFEYLPCGLDFVPLMKGYSNPVVRDVDARI